MLKMIADCVHGIFFAIGGLCFGIAVAAVTMLLFAGTDPDTTHTFVGYVFLFWVLGLVLVMRAPSSAAAWSQLISGIGLMMFLLPIALMIKVQSSPTDPGFDLHTADPLSLLYDLSGISFVCIGIALMCALKSYRLDKRAKQETKESPPA